MRSDKRGPGVFVRYMFGGALLLAGVTACTPLVGGAALLGAVSIGVLTSRCYDYVDVTVLDADGRKTCAATVTASNGSSQFEFSSCYYGVLTDGRWTLRATLPGSADAIAQVQVDHAHDCTRYVQSLELTLNRPGTPTALKAVRPTHTVPVAPPPVVAPPAPATPSAQPSEPAASSATPPNPPAPASATPPLGVFPDSAPATH